MSWIFLCDLLSDFLINANVFLSFFLEEFVHLFFLISSIFVVIVPSCRVSFISKAGPALRIARSDLTAASALSCLTRLVSVMRYSTFSCSLVCPVGWWFSQAVSEVSSYQSFSEFFLNVQASLQREEDSIRKRHQKSFCLLRKWLVTYLCRDVCGTIGLCRQLVGTTWSVEKNALSVSGKGCPLDRGDRDRDTSPECNGALISLIHDFRSEAKARFFMPEALFAKLFKSAL